MLETLQTNNYSIDSYELYNDNLLYLDYIDQNYTFKEIVVEPKLAYANQGNLIGLFKELEIPPSLYLYTMHINGFNNPYTFNGKLDSLKLAIKPSIPLS